MTSSSCCCRSTACQRGVLREGKVAGQLCRSRGRANEVAGDGSRGGLRGLARTTTGSPYFNAREIDAAGTRNHGDHRCRHLARQERTPVNAREEVLACNVGRATTRVVADAKPRARLAAEQFGHDRLGGGWQVPDGEETSLARLVTKTTEAVHVPRWCLGEHAPLPSLTARQRGIDSRQSRVRVPVSTAGMRREGGLRMQRELKDGQR